MSFRESPSEFKPTIRFTQKELPEIKGMEINSKHTLQIEVRLKNKGEDIWGEKGIGGTFLIEGVKSIDEDKIKKLKARFQ